MQYPKKTQDEKKKAIMLLAKCKRQGFTLEQIFWVDLTLKSFTFEQATYIAQKRWSDEIMQGIYEAYGDGIEISVLEKYQHIDYLHHFRYLIQGLKSNWSDDKIKLLTNTELGMGKLAHIEKALETCPIELVQIFARKEVPIHKIVVFKRFVIAKLEMGLSVEAISETLKAHVALLVLEH